MVVSTDTRVHVVSIVGGSQSTWWELPHLFDLVTTR